MASFNNRHWPSMFRSKHAAQPWQTQAPADISGSPPSLVSGGSTTTTTTGSSVKHSSSFPGGGEERTPDPKPRWNPRPEQIRILEAIFNSGMVNPPRDEIPRIRLRLQEYGPVGDANVFYWFQNRKARSKNKMRAAGCAGGRAAPARALPVRAPPARHTAAALVVSSHPPPPPPQIQTQQQPVQVQLLSSPSPVPQQQQQQAPTSSSSSSSDRSSGSSRPAAKPASSHTMSATEAMDLLGPLAAACPQVYYQQGQPTHARPPSPKAQQQQQDHVTAANDEPIFLQWPQGYCLSAAELSTILGAQYSTHVPPAAAQPLQASPPAPVPFLGLCNDVVAGHRTWGSSGLGQHWPSSGDHHHQFCKNTAAALNAVVVTAKELAAHQDDNAGKPAGLLRYDFGVSASMDAASAAAVSTLPLSTSPNAAVTVASVAASTAGLTGGLAATTAANNAVVSNYDQFQGGLVADAVTGDGAPASAAPAAPEDEDNGVAVLCIGDSATGRSVVREVAARHLDVRAQFGEAAVLFRNVGDGERPVQVPVDAASGCTVQPLQHGVVYWVLV